MDDVFAFAAFIALVVPLIFIIMLAKIMARQNRYRDEIAQTLRKIEDALREDRKLLRKLSQRSTAPVAEEPQPAVFQPHVSSIEKVLFESPPLAAVEPEQRAEETVIESIAEQAPAVAPENPWRQADWQSPEPSRFELAAKG
ncbi:MAG: hypothetical protein LUQ11_10255 [Methylococcaceae bacterium]|nr:hypothetical protein [Methylococcaceae bacterium]